MKIHLQTIFHDFRRYRSKGWNSYDECINILKRKYAIESL